METRDLLKFITEKGFRTLEEIRLQYPVEDVEVMDTQLSYMASRNSLRKVLFQDGNGKVGELYYIPR